jgi:hypothetical protein
MWAALNVISGFLLSAVLLALAASDDAEFPCQEKHDGEDHYPQQQPPPWRVKKP